MLSTFCPQGLAFAPKSEQLNYWLREKPLEMRIVLDRFCKFACEFSRFCPISAGEGSRLTWIDRSFLPNNWSEGEELLLSIQANFAREFTAAEYASVLLEPCC